jgi:PAS domain S-box-containing protein
VKRAGFFPRGGMVFHLVLLTSGLVAATALAVAAVTLTAAARQAEEAVDRRLADGAASFTATIQDELAELGSLAGLLAAGRSVAVPIESGDQALLFERIGPMLQRRGVNELLVANPRDGSIVAVMEESGRERPLEPLSGAGFDRARVGQIALSVMPGSGGGLWHEAYAPVYGTTSGEVIAVVRLSSPLDEADLVQFRARTQLEAILLLPNGTMISTLRALDGSDQDDAATLSQIIGNASANDIVLADRRYRVHSVAVKETDATDVATLVLAVPRTTVESRVYSAVIPVLPLTLLIISIGGMLAANLAWRVRQPVVALATAAAKLRDGDLATPVPPVRAIDLAPLADALEEARQRIAAYLAAAEAEEAHLRAIFEALREPVLTVDANGQIVGCNESAIALFGPAVQLIGWPIKDVLPFVMEASDDTTSVSGTVTDIPGNAVEVEVSKTPLRESGLPIAAVYVIHDISHHAEVNRLREQLLYNVSHELRAPMAVLESALDMLGTDYVDLSAREFDNVMQSARRTVARLHQLMDDLLSAGNIQSGRFMVRPVPIQLEPLFQEAQEAVAAGLEARQQWVEVTIASSVNEILADPRYLRQVIVNLLANASKYSPEGTALVLQAEPLGAKVRIYVQDWGQGIPATEQKGLFERFYRVRPGNEEPGIGLGLAIAKGIIEAHGGRIGVQSSPGLGTTVWFTLPLPANDEDDAAAGVQATPNGAHVADEIDMPPNGAHIADVADIAGPGLRAGPG